MKVLNSWYEHGTVVHEDRISMEWVDHTQYMTPQYTCRYESELNKIKLDGPIALLYVGGASVSNCETIEADYKVKCSVDNMKTGPVIKSTQAYMMHKYAGILARNGNYIAYASISANTCASSMHSIYEAERLLRDEVVKYVVIVAEEKTSKDTIRIFKEHMIDLVVGEGFACIVLSNDVGGVQITDSKWAYRYSTNPFLVSKEGYELVKSECDVVKGHQTGTVQNDTAERDAFGDNIVGYKAKIGHCQGASGLIEVCMVIEDQELQGDILCTASGLGGFYGSCIVKKASNEI